MTKIYRRSTLKKGHMNPEKEHPRTRDTIINFRVTPKEKELIDARIKLSGLDRSEFFIESCLYQKILVRGNIKSFTAIRDQIEALTKDIIVNPNLDELSNEQAESLKTILEILESRFRKEKTDQ